MNLSLQVMLLLFLILLLAIFLTLVFLKNLSKRQNSQKNFTEKLVQKLEKLSEGQQQLYGGLKNISDGQSAGQANILKHVESRLNEVQKSMSDNLSGSASQTARTLGELHERLTTIDKAQNNIEKLSGNVLTLQDILSNKQAHPVAAHRCARHASVAGHPRPRPRRTRWFVERRQAARAVRGRH